MQQGKTVKTVVKTAHLERKPRTNFISSLVFSGTNDQTDSVWSGIDQED